MVDVIVVGKRRKLLNVDELRERQLNDRRECFPLG
jgi:hypothetical protein